MEDTIKSLLPGVNTAVLVGEARKFVSLLVTLKTTEGENGAFTDELTGAALDVSPGCTTASAAINDPAWQSYIQAGIDEYNANHTVSNAARIRKFAVLATEFSVAGGELTPTLKLKRGVVHDKYSDVIDAFYV